MTRVEIQTFVRTLVNVPFIDRGRSMLGLDCIGVGCMVGMHFGVPYQDAPPDYSLWPAHDRRILTYFDRYLVPLRMDEPTGPRWIGSVGVMAGDQLPAHIGIFTWKRGMLHLVHARKDKEKVLEQAYSQSDRSEGRVIARYDFPGVEN